MKPNHTPTPYYRLVEYDGGQWFQVFADHNNGELVARFPRRDQAEKFVLAVNSHEALLEAAKKVADFVPHEIITNMKTMLDRHEENCMACDLHKAIAQAEGKAS